MLEKALNKMFHIPVYGNVLYFATALPTTGAPGYAKGCLCLVLGTGWYINAGTSSACSWTVCVLT